ncbi:unnamed protein product [Orchesella dallaii]|uniref:Uncharacterized protein n=1 Tax=Orchesella dallaii TaxID=48710 RepID=A0ABP1RXP9_9HEXA
MKLNDLKKLSYQNESCEPILEQLAQDLLAKHEELHQICVDLNEILNIILPCINMASIITMSRFFLFCLRKSWLGVANVTLKLITTWAIYIVGIKIANKSASFKSWFTTKKTINQLKLSSNEYQGKLDELNTLPIGIGTDIFYTNVGFIASHIGIILTYLFITADAISESCRR